MSPENEKREWLTRPEIIQLVTADLKVVLSEMVREMISDEMQPYHIENKVRFARLETELMQNTMALGVIKETNFSQNREISNIGSRQAERYVQQVREEERACSDRESTLQELREIKAKMFTEATDSARRDGRKAMTDEYWTKGKAVVAAGSGLATGAAGKALWPLLKRWFHW